MAHSEERKKYDEYMNGLESKIWWAELLTTILGVGGVALFFATVVFGSWVLAGGTVITLAAMVASFIREENLKTEYDDQSDLLIQ